MTHTLIFNDTVLQQHPIHPVGDKNKIKISAIQENHFLQISKVSRARPESRASFPQSLFLLTRMWQPFRFFISKNTYGLPSLKHSAWPSKKYAPKYNTGLGFWPTARITSPLADHTLLLSLERFSLLSSFARRSHVYRAYVFYLFFSRGKIAVNISFCKTDVFTSWG